MNAMNKQHFDIPVYNPSCFKKLPTLLIFFSSFLFAPNFWWTRRAHFISHWKST